MGSHIVGRVEEIPPGSRKIIEAEKRSIGIFNIRGNFFAVRNVCPHQGAPLCLGRIRGTMESSVPGEYEYVMDGEILVCPWHCWEFHIKTGRSIFNPHRMRVKNYEVTIEPDQGDEPSIETFDVTTERGNLVLHI